MSLKQITCPRIRVYRCIILMNFVICLCQFHFSLHLTGLHNACMNFLPWCAKFVQLHAVSILILMFATAWQHWAYKQWCWHQQHSCYFGHLCCSLGLYNSMELGLKWFSLAEVYRPKSPYIIIIYILVIKWPELFLKRLIYAPLVSVSIRVDVPAGLGCQVILKWI